MNILFSNSVEIEEGFTAHDIEYLRKQILTRRSVLSDQQKSTNLVSHLFESAKTMLTACEFIGAVDMPRAIATWERIKIEVLVPKEDNTNPEAVPISTVYAKGIIRCIDEKYQNMFRLELLSQYTMKPVREFGATFYLQPRVPANILAGANIPAKPDINKIDGLNRELVRLGCDRRLANPNMVLAYQENFPAPTVFVNTLRDTIILPGVNQFMKSMFDTHFVTE